MTAADISPAILGSLSESAKGATMKHRSRARVGMRLTVAYWDQLSNLMLADHVLGVGF